MNAQLAKSLGWLQFAVSTLASVFEHGIPTSPLGWLGILGTLATAGAVHAAASTDGSK